MTKRIADEKLSRECRPYKDELERQVPALGTGNILGIGYGPRIARGIRQQDRALRIYVRCKTPKDQLLRDEVLPVAINGLDTDVLEVGEIEALSREWAVSIKHKDSTGGTLASFVTLLGNPTELCLLSCNHVIAGANHGKRGDPVFHATDGGAEPVAVLHDLQNLKMTTVDQAPANMMDAAMARLTDPAYFHHASPSIGEIRAAGLATDGQSVIKMGWVTGQTLGKVDDLSARISVKYGLHRALFEDQVSIVPGGPEFFAVKGDSGALVLDEQNRSPIGLLFAGTRPHLLSPRGSLAFLNPIQPIIYRFAIEQFLSAAPRMPT